MKKMALSGSLAVFVCVGLLCSPVRLMASTEAQKQAAIDAGLAYLASQQNPDGSWSYGSYPQAATGAALLAFVEQKYKPLGWNGQDYSAVVTNATGYLLSTASQIDISAANWWGFKGTANSGIGIDWYGNGETTYTSGLVLPALCRLTDGIVTPTTVISSANAAVDGLTYAQLIQRAVDVWVWGQTGPPGGNFDGGWRYVPNTNQSDGSTAQWGALALLYAQSVQGITVPTQTKTELINWINYIQNPTDGSCGYTDPNGSSGILNDESKTGGLLIQMAFAGGGGSQGKALAYLNTNWKNTANGAWYGNFGNPYAMWSIYKGLEITIGRDAGTGTISNLNPDPGDVDNPNHGWNWWEDYCNWLVLNQNASGSWTGYQYWTDPLSTAWDISILSGTVLPPPQPKVQSVAPVMGHVALGFVALLLLVSGALIARGSRRLP
jgi:hypothetical protein